MELSDYILERKRNPIRALLQRTGITSEDWLVDLLIVLRAARRDELILSKAFAKSHPYGYHSYGEFFETGSPEIVGTSIVATGPNLGSEHVFWTSLPYFTDIDDDLIGLVVCLQAARKISLETISRQCLTINTANNKFRSLNLYLDWCLEFDQSVLHTLLKFETFATEDKLAPNSEIDRLGHFHLLRGVILGRLFDGKYLSIHDLVEVSMAKPSSIDELEVWLSHLVGSSRTLEGLVRDLRIISRRSQGKTLEGIAIEVGITRERVRQVLRSYRPFVTDDYLASRSSAHAALQSHTRLVQTAAEEMLIIKRIVSCIRDAPGISVQELSTKIDVVEEVCEKCIPKGLRKFVANRLDREAAKMWSNEQILEVLQLAANYAYPLAAGQYDLLRRRGAFIGPSAVLVMTRFGDWSAACDLAGVASGSRPHRDYVRAWSNEDLWKILIRYFLDSNTTGTLSDFDSWLRMSESAYPSRANFRLRLGSWTIIKEEVFGRLLVGDQLFLFRSYCDGISMAVEESA